MTTEVGQRKQGWTTILHGKRTKKEAHRGAQHSTAQRGAREREYIDDVRDVDIAPIIIW